MGDKSLEIVRAHDGETGYRWYLGVGMDLIEALKEVTDSGKPGDVEDLGSTLTDVLLDCVPALGVALIHICSRHHLIRMASIVGKDDPRFEKLTRKYRSIISEVVKVRQSGAG